MLWSGSRRGSGESSLVARVEEGEIEVEGEVDEEFCSKSTVGLGFELEVARRRRGGLGRLVIVGTDTVL